MTLPELASKLRLTPTKVRLDLSELERKGWTQLGTDEVVHITPQGENAYAFISEHPEIIQESIDQPIEGDFDLDAAIDDALQSGSDQATAVDTKRDNQQGTELSGNK